MNESPRRVSVFLLRHAVAAPHTSPARDAERPLTPEGRAKMKKAVRGLKKIQPAFSVIFTSPLKRARQTAEIVAQAYAAKAKLKPLPDLAPGGAPKKVEETLRAQPAGGDVLLVGHQPDLGRLLSLLVFNNPDAHFPLKKGGMARVDLIFAAKSPVAELRWLLSSKHLRLMAGD